MKAALAIVCLAVAACAAASPLAALVAERPIVLLGEVHDNTAQHAERLAALHALVERGARPALLFEQFERERQADIDRVRAASGDADALIAAGSARKAGWNWESYKPFVALALRHDLPIVAANVSRADARRIIDDGLAVHGFDAALPAGLLREQAAAVERGHCGLIDARAARRLALAQIARDQQMARLVAEHAARGVVLLAGNGHVRSDIGVPRWLAPALREQTLSIGLLEAHDAGGVAPGAYDRTLITPSQPRADPCAPLRTSSIASP